MTSPYLDTPTRSLEQLRDELRATAKDRRRRYVVSGNQTDYRSMLQAENRLAAVEAQIAARAQSEQSS